MLRQSAAQVERRSFALVPGGTRQMVYVPDHLKSSWLGRIAQLVEQLTLNQNIFFCAVPHSYREVPVFIDFLASLTHIHRR